MAIAGFSKKDVSVRVVDNEIKVKGEKTEKHENVKYHMKELSNRAFAKSIAIPKNIDNAKIDAKFENGVLEITLPKVEKSNSGSVREVVIS